MNLSKLFFILLILLSISYSFSQKRTEKEKEYKIQIALLLDVSGSMDGLIAQAKGQIWRMINELSKAKKKGEKAEIEIALGSFGNEAFRESGHFKLHSPLTKDYDLFSEKLFDLKTSGSNEYCGHAIMTALDSIDWSKDKKDLKVIFIAGNEAFDQGATDYTKACKLAIDKRIIINTIYCGKEEEGIQYLWADGAKKGKGKYLTINQDTTSKLYETFWDNKFIEYNEQINGTYIPYGVEGEKFLKRQVMQDKNALLLGKLYLRERLIFKITRNYQNPHWDIVDAYQQDSLILEKLDEEDFPANMHSMNEAQKLTYIQKQHLLRGLYIEGAEVCYQKAKAAIMKLTDGGDYTPTLDNSIIETIREQGKKLGFEF